MSSAMKVHHAIARKGPFGGTLTTTLCGRMNAGSRDGMNSSAKLSEVTCKFCLRSLDGLAANPTAQPDGGRKA